MNMFKGCLQKRPPAFLAVLLTTSLAILVLTQLAPAQTTQKQQAAKVAKDPAPKAGSDKRPLTHNDYEIWNSIQGSLISPNGQFVAYTLNSPSSGSELIVKDVVSKNEYRHGSGGAAKAPDAEGGKGGPAAEGAAGTAGKAAFTADSSRLVFVINTGKGGKGKAGGGKGAGKGAKQEPQAAKEEKKEQDKDKAQAKGAPQPSLGIMDLSTGKVTVIAGVRNFVLPENSGEGLVYHKSPVQTAAKDKDGGLPDDEDDSDDDVVQKGQKGGGKKGGAGGGAAKQGAPQAKSAPTDLVIHSFRDDTDKIIPDVTDFLLTRDGRVLVCVIAPKGSNEDADTKDAVESGVFAFVPAGDSGGLTKVALATGKAKYSRFSWDEKQRRLAFFADHGTSAKDQGKLSVCLWDMEDNAKRKNGQIGRAPQPDQPNESPAAVEILNSSMKTGLRDGCVLVERGGISFTEDGSKIILGVARPQDKDAAKAPAAKDEKKDEKVVVELWHWKDDFIQPMQKAKGQQDRNRVFTAVYHIKSNKLVQLGDQTLPQVSMSRDGNTAIGSDDTGYRKLIDYDGNYSDVYLVNTFDGTRKPFLKKHHWGTSFSPSGRFAMYYDGTDWNTVDLPGGAVTNITKKIREQHKTSFANVDHDSPSAAPAYGIAGWSSDEYFVLLYDKYDIWQVGATGNGFRNLTGDYGKRNQAPLRLVKLDPKEKSIDVSRPMVLRYEKLSNRATGFAVLDPNGKEPIIPIKELPAFIGPVTKAKQANMLMFTAQSYYNYPDLWVASIDFKESYRISDANPQKSQFIWGYSELVHYKNADGVPLTGVLIKPENFDSSKKYPMIVYIYEKLSQNLHHFVLPKEGTSINATYYASNGYLVFMPDIVYTVGYPGQSALKSVLPAIQAVVDQGIVDENAIGIQGHSWGGYQIAYMVTQTNRFKAAAAGAPVSNMTSAYDGIRWGTGMPRQFQYEKTQSRIGGTLWDYPMRFVENSPVFMADRVKTPLLILHNDHDDAVPWYQGIEYYLALRRLGKEVYMFNYPDELHGLRKKVNQKDYTIRMQEFFDHHLRGAPAPGWMIHGIPYAPRGPQKEAPAGGGEGG